VKIGLMTGDMEYIKCNISENKKVGNFKYSGSKVIAKEFKKK
jgi:hypothetical protein